jgi:hypothetical protein
MTAQCMSCGELGDQCCTKENTAPALKGNLCVGQGVCVNDVCTSTQGNWRQACEVGKADCNKMFKGLHCVPNGKGADWCDCVEESDGMACRPGSVCGPLA